MKTEKEIKAKIKKHQKLEAKSYWKSDEYFHHGIVMALKWILGDE